MELIYKWKSGLRAKLLLVGFVPLMLLIIIVSWASRELRTLQTTVVEDFGQRTEAIRLSGQMESSLNAMARWFWLSYATRSDASKQNTFIANAKNEILKFDTAVNEFSKSKNNKEVEAKLKEVHRRWSEAKSAVLVGLSHFEKGQEADYEAGKIHILSFATPHLIPITNELNAATEIIKNQADKEVIIQSERTNKSVLILFVLSLSAALWIILFTIYLAVNLVKIFSTLSTSLTHSCDDLGTTSAHMSSISFELSQTATSQASALSQISSSLEQVTAMVGKNSDNSRVSASESSNAASRAHEGQEIVVKLVSSIEEIDKSNSEIMGKVNESSEKFTDIINVIKEIETKTKVINDIVFQTKLLSFNASVEAARAGEHGNGFAVVAEEVGKLAEMSGRSATEISHMLTQSIVHVENIVQDTQKNVSACIKEGNVKVQAGMKVANECRTVLTEVSDSIQKASSVAQDISIASEEQKIGVGEILKAVNQLDTITHRNTQMSNEAAQSAKELESYADSVSKNVNSFMYVLDGNALKITRFPWSEKLVLHVDDMDNQHKVLVEKMDHFFHCLDNEALPETQKAFKALAEATVFHFREEERFLASISYPNLASHKKIHQDLVNTVLKHGEELDRGTIKKYEVADFLKNWLSVHIMGQDQHYSRFYHKDY